MGYLCDDVASGYSNGAHLISGVLPLPYTEMVIREAIRLYPPVPIFAREPIKDVSIGG